MNPPLPSALKKGYTGKDIHGQPMSYTIVGEDVFLAKSSPGKNKAFAIHKLRFSDGREQFRIGYYMIAERPRVKGKWACGQFAPMMTSEEMAEIFDRAKKLSESPEL
jgi:hypothetical protein